MDTSVYSPDMTVVVVGSLTQRQVVWMVLAVAVRSIDPSPPLTPRAAEKRWCLTQRTARRRLSSLNPRLPKPIASSTPTCEPNH